MVEDEGIPDERPWRRREYSSARSTLGVATLVVLVVGVAIWYLEFRGDSGGGVDAGQYGIIALPDELNPTDRNPAAEVGRAAPNFVVPTLDGGEATLAEYRGQPVLINFWASWCQPCRGEAPDLQALHDENPDLVVLGINQQQTAEEAEKFRVEFKLTFPLALDLDGEISQAYRAIGLPVTVLVNGEGVIVQMWRARIIAEDVEANLAELQ